MRQEDADCNAAPSTGIYNTQLLSLPTMVSATSLRFAKYIALNTAVTVMRFYYIMLICFRALSDAYLNGSRSLRVHTKINAAIPSTVVAFTSIIRFSIIQKCQIYFEH